MYIFFSQYCLLILNQRIYAWSFEYTLLSFRITQDDYILKIKKNPKIYNICFGKKPQKHQVLWNFYLIQLKFTS